MSTKNKINELVSILESTGKHTSYQAFPPQFPVDQLPDDQSPVVSRQDELRFQWLQSKLNDVSGLAIDIGANLGYFSFRLQDQYKINVVAYEPYEPHAKSIELIRDICKIDEAQIRVENSGVGLREIDAIPQSELIALLNVIQHAGDDFDADLVPTIDDWRSYAVDYLTAIRAKTNLLFFQTGYSWLGHGAKLCPDEKNIDFTVSLLKDSGWNILHCGAIHKIREDSPYRDYEISLDGHNRVLIPEQRTTLASRIKRKLTGVTISPALHRFCQRPLWLCESK